MPIKYDKPIPALLLTDFYKTCHKAFYNPSTTQLISYWTPRKSRVAGINEVVCFGLQALIKKYLIDHFAVTFFDRPWDEVRDEYMDYITATFDKDIAESEVEAFKAIHEVGYLPIAIRAVPEGTRVPIGCPMIEFRATEEWSYWLVNYLETLCSCNLWMPMTAATIADHNRALVDEWYGKTVDDNVPLHIAAGDFSMRGMGGVDAAVMADAGHLLSFSSTATIPTAWWLRNFYNAPLSVCKGTPSTEHSVVESYGEAHEMEYYEHVATEVRPAGVLSMVSDTWDLWRVLTEYLPALKDKLMARDGKVVIRPDSGNPIDILCGTLLSSEYMTIDGLTVDGLTDYFMEYARKKYPWNGASETWYRVRIGNTLYKVTAEHRWEDDEEDKSSDGYYSDTVDAIRIEETEITPEMKGVIELLWDLAGGTVNSKGYKVVDKHFGAIYGDAITHDRAEQIFSRLAAKGFAANNVVLGFGSYTYQYVTRDTFGFALKVTHGIVNGKETMMYKDPITDKGKHSAGKKSQMGMCIVKKNDDGSVSYTDHHTIAEADAPGNLLRPVFRNGELLVDDDFLIIRSRLHPDF